MTSETSVSPTESALRRFQRSMVIDIEAWRDGIGYDLAALGEATTQERAEIERLLLAHRPRDWRDVEALALLDTPAARAALTRAAGDGDSEIRLAVARYAPALIAEKRRAASLVRALRTAEPFGGLSQALDEAEAFHPPAVIRALFRGVLGRPGEVAVHFAALLLFLHGGAESAFDDAHRPFFLRFNTEDPGEREVALVELCARVGLDAASVIAQAKGTRRSKPGCQARRGSPRPT